MGPGRQLVLCDFFVMLAICEFWQHVGKALKENILGVLLQRRGTVGSSVICLPRAQSLGRYTTTKQKTSNAIVHYNTFQQCHPLLCVRVVPRSEQERRIGRTERFERV